MLPRPGNRVGSRHDFSATQACQARNLTGYEACWKSHQPRGFGLAKPGPNATISPIARRPIGQEQGRTSMKTLLRASAICLLFAGSAIALTGERMPEISLDKMTPDQRAVADAIMSGP